MSTIKFTKMYFEEVITRLKLSLNTKKDSDIAMLFGYEKSTFSQRKLRGAIPVDKIKLICKEKGLNEEWIFEGTGEMVRSPGDPTTVNEHGPAYDPIPRLTPQQMEAAALLGKLSEAEQDELIRKMKDDIIDMLTKKK